MELTNGVRACVRSRNDDVEGRRRVRGMEPGATPVHPQSSRLIRGPAALSGIVKIVEMVERPAREVSSSSGSRSPQLVRDVQIVQARPARARGFDDAERAVGLEDNGFDAFERGEAAVTDGGSQFVMWGVWTCVWTIA
jgi:hypothetical protein